MAQLPSTKCSVCNDKIGNLYCHDCEHFLCQTCKPLHDIFPANKQHILTDASKEGRRVFKSKRRCEIHKKDYALYCKNCDCLMCTECISSNHYGHQCGDYKCIVENRRQHMIAISEQLQAKISQIEECIKKIQTDIVSKVKSESEKFVTQVHFTAKEFDNIIVHVKTMHETTASDYVSTEIKNLQHVQEQLEHFQKNYSELSIKVKNILLEQHDVTFFFEQTSIPKELEYLEEMPNIPKPNTISHFESDKFTDLVVEGIRKKFNIRKAGNPSIICSLKKTMDENTRLKEQLQKTEHDKLCKETESQQFSDKLKEEQIKSTKLKEVNDKLEREITRLNEIEKGKTDEITQLSERLRQMQDSVKEQQSLKSSLNESMDESNRLKEKLKKTEHKKLSKEAKSQQFNDKLKEEQRKSPKLTEDNDKLERELARLVEFEKGKTDGIVQMKETLRRKQDTEKENQSLKRYNNCR